MFVIQVNCLVVVCSKYYVKFFSMAQATYLKIACRSYFSCMSDNKLEVLEEILLDFHEGPVSKSRIIEYFPRDRRW